MMDRCRIKKRERQQQQLKSNNNNNKITRMEGTAVDSQSELIWWHHLASDRSICTKSYQQVTILDDLLPLCDDLTYIFQLATEQQSMLLIGAGDYRIQLGEKSSNYSRYAEQERNGDGGHSHFQDTGERE